MSIATKMLTQLSKTPMRFGEVQNFVFKHSARYKQGETKAPGVGGVITLEFYLIKKLLNIILKAY